MLQDIIIEWSFILEVRLDSLEIVYFIKLGMHIKNI